MFAEDIIKDSMVVICWTKDHELTGSGIIPKSTLCRLLESLINQLNQ